MTKAIGVPQGPSGSLGDRLGQQQGNRATGGCAICGGVLPAERLDFCSEGCRSAALADMTHDLKEQH